jgi:AraC-like DNA-binding protein
MPGPFLERRAIFRTRDPEEARSFLAGKSIAMSLAHNDKAPGSFHTILNGVYLSGLWLGYIAYGSRLVLRVAPSRDDYWAHFPLRSGFAASTAGETLDCDARRGVVTCPTEIHELQVAPNSERLSLSIQRDALEKHLAALLGAAPTVPLAFAPRVDLESGAGRSLAGFLRLAATEFDSDGMLANPLLARQFEQLVLTSLLTSQPNNYSSRLRQRPASIAPRDVGRALDYIHENAGEPIALADLVAVSGVAGRTLIKHFRDVKGVSPMRYLRAVRLERVRAELAQGTSASVMATAFRWGFAHAGRFAIDYRNRFGESPSTTLTRARAANGPR